MDITSIYELLHTWFYAWLIFQVVDQLGSIFAGCRKSFSSRK